jgi:hypothetical protein
MHHCIRVDPQMEMLAKGEHIAGASRASVSLVNAVIAGLAVMPAVGVQVEGAVLVDGRAEQHSAATLRQGKNNSNARSSFAWWVGDIVEPNVNRVSASGMGAEPSTEHCLPGRGIAKAQYLTRYASRGLAWSQREVQLGQCAGLPR